MTILHNVRQFVLKFGIELNRYNPAQSQRARGRARGKDIMLATAIRYRDRTGFTVSAGFNGFQHLKFSSID